MQTATFCDRLIHSGRVLCLQLLQAPKLRHQDKKRPLGRFLIYFIVGIENSAPARRPVGQRAVMVFIRV